MSSKILNIEIGEGVSKVCCALPSKKGYCFSESFMFKTPDGCVMDGVIKDVYTLADKLRLELEERNLRAIKSVVFTVASGKVASREVRMPFMKDKKISGTVRTNAADYFPVDISKYHITHHVLERVKGKEGFCRVLVLAVPLSLLEGYFKLAELSKMEIIAIDSCSNSHYQAIKQLREPKVSMYVDVDCSASFVSFIQGESLLLQRTFAFGGGDLITAYMEKEGLGSDEYIRALTEVSEGSQSFVGNHKVGESIIQDELSRLVYSIVRSVDYFNSFHWEAATAQIVLMGACGRVAGLQELVVSATDLPTIYLEEVPGLGALGGGAEISSYISCMGCNIAPVNFIPDSFRRRKRSERSPGEESLVKGIVGSGVLVLGAIALAALALMSYKQAQGELARTKAEIASLEPAEQMYLTYSTYKQTQQALLELRALSENPNRGLAAFFKELEEKMPSKIMLLSSVCTIDGVSMRITVPGLEEAAVVVSQFRSFETISSIEISTIEAQWDEGGYKTFIFTLDCKYGINPYINNINPYEDVFIEETAQDDASAQGQTANETEAEQ